MLRAYPDSFGSLQRLALRHTLDRFPSNKELEMGEVLVAVSTSSMTGGRIMGPVSGDTSVDG